MKNHIYLFSIMLLIVIFISSCESKTNEAYNNLFENHIISVDQGVNMYKEFQEKRTNVVEPILKEIYKDSTFQDTKFISFSLNDIKEYLAFIEAIQKENPKQDISGIRIYFGAYPNQKKIKDIIGEKKIKHPRQQTVFMVPTIHVGNFDKEYKNLNNLPFYIKGTEENPLKGDFVIIEDLMLNYNKQQRIDFYNKNFNISKASFNLNTATTLKGETKIMSPIFNEGEMSPPPNKKYN